MEDDSASKQKVVPVGKQKQEGTVAYYGELEQTGNGSKFGRKNKGERVGSPEQWPTTYGKIEAWSPNFFEEGRALFVFKLKIVPVFVFKKKKPKENQNLKN